MNNEEKILTLLGQLTADMADMKGHMAKLDGRMDKLDSRMDKLDSRMDKLDSRMDKLEERQTKAEVVLENVIVPRLDALAEGQKNLLETLAPKSRVETLEEEISILRMAVRTLASDVNELKQAQ